MEMLDKSSKTDMPGWLKAMLAVGSIPVILISVIILFLTALVVAVVQSEAQDINRLWSVRFTDINTGWAVGASGRIIKTSDGGLTWVKQVSGSEDILTSADFIDGNTGWVVGRHGTVLKTTNAGATWTTIRQGTAGLAHILSSTPWFESVDFVDATTGWAAGRHGVILKTVDGGGTWAEQNSGTKSDFDSVVFSDLNTGWAVGEHGVIIKTADGGTTWTAKPSGTTKRLNSLHFVDANTGWIVGEEGTVLKTSDGGNTWSPQTSGTTKGLKSVYLADANTGWAVGASILKSSDGGSTWIEQRSSQKGSLNSLHVIDANTGWAVGEQGVILKTADSGATWLAQDGGSSPVGTDTSPWVFLAVLAAGIVMGAFWLSMLASCLVRPAWSFPNGDGGARIAWALGMIFIPLVSLAYFFFVYVRGYRELAKANAIQRLGNASGMMMWIGATTVILGVVSEVLEFQILEFRPVVIAGWGIEMVLLGIVFFVLAVFTLRRSLVALTAALVIYGLDTMNLLVVGGESYITQGFTGFLFLVGLFVAWHMLALIVMGLGVGAIRNLRSQSPNRTEEVVPPIDDQVAGQDVESSRVTEAEDGEFWIANSEGKSAPPKPPRGSPTAKLGFAVGVIYFMGFANVAVGMVTDIYRIQVLQEVGFGVFSVLWGVVFLTLGFFTHRRSLAALTIAVLLYVLDGLLLSYVAFRMPKIEVLIFVLPNVMWHFFFLSMMVPGIGAIRQLKREGAPITTRRFAYAWQAFVVAVVAGLAVWLGLYQGQAVRNSIVDVIRLVNLDREGKPSNEVLETAVLDAAGLAGLEPQAYLNTSKGFSIRQPIGWKAEDSTVSLIAANGEMGQAISDIESSGGSLEVMFFNTQPDEPGAVQFSENINVTSGNNRLFGGMRDSDLDEFFEAESKELPENMRILESKKVLVNGVKAYLSSMAMTQDGIPMKAVQLTLIKNGRVYIVTGTALEASWDQYRGVIEASLLTFTVN
ncbi:MAG: YCF48-related protein [Candidatus Aquicultorales bacterium]